MLGWLGAVGGRGGCRDEVMATTTGDVVSPGDVWSREGKLWRDGGGDDDGLHLLGGGAWQRAGQRLRFIQGSCGGALDEHDFLASSLEKLGRTGTGNSKSQNLHAVVCSQLVCSQFPWTFVALNENTTSEGSRE